MNKTCCKIQHWDRHNFHLFMSLIFTINLCNSTASVGVQIKVQAIAEIVHTSHHTHGGYEPNIRFVLWYLVIPAICRSGIGRCIMSGYGIIPQEFWRVKAARYALLSDVIPCFCDCQYIPSPSQSQPSIRPYTGRRKETSLKHYNIPYTLPCKLIIWDGRVLVTAITTATCRISWPRQFDKRSYCSLSWNIFGCLGRFQQNNVPTLYFLSWLCDVLSGHEAPWCGYRCTTGLEIRNNGLVLLYFPQTLSFVYDCFCINRCNKDDNKKSYKSKWAEWIENKKDKT